MLDNTFSFRHKDIILFVSDIRTKSVAPLMQGSCHEVTEGYSLRYLYHLPVVYTTSRLCRTPPTLGGELVPTLGEELFDLRGRAEYKNLFFCL